MRILVKFTRTYCSEAHKVCEDLDLEPPVVPHLYAVNQMAGHCICVVMELIVGAVHFTAKQGRQAAQDLSRAVNALHARDLVHADLRCQNILVRDDRAFLVDFDWSGLRGQQMYPAFMNHEGINWAVDASDLMVVKKSHDIHFMNMLM